MTFNWKTYGGVKIAQADALQAMASHDHSSLDAVISDPPYCSNGFNEGSRTNSKGLTKMHVRNGSWFDGDAMTTAGLSWLLREIARASARALKPGGSLLLFCDWKMVPSLAPMIETAGLRWRGHIVWDKISPGQGPHGFRYQHETILWFLKGASRDIPPGLKTRGNVIQCKRIPPKTRRHPTEKPVDLLIALLESTVPVGGLVADPFAGSGALGAAAVQVQRQALLSDADPKWFEVMIDRFEHP